MNRPIDPWTRKIVAHLPGTVEQVSERTGFAMHPRDGIRDIHVTTRRALLALRAHGLAECDLDGTWRLTEKGRQTFTLAARPGGRTVEHVGAHSKVKARPAE